MPPYRAYSTEDRGNAPPTLARAQSSANSYGRGYGDPSEHMLKRKTPNGTLAAGYDGTPVQWTGKAPPLKHVVLPLSSDIVDQRGKHVETRLFDNSGLRNNSASQGWSHGTDFDMASYSSSQDMRLNCDPGNWTQVPPLSDTKFNTNFWSNGHMAQSTPYLSHNGIQIPTVNQPSYQIAPGPTISNDGGLYGPYWPDGKFVPYRPAAYRIQDMHHSNHAWQPNDMQQLYKAPSEMLPPFPPAMFRNQVDSAPRDGHLPFMTDNRHYNMEGRYATPVQTNTQHITADLCSSYADGSRTPTAASPEHSNNNLHFKERTLSWAHSIYVDLLTYLHQTKGDSRKSRPVHGVRSYAKNNIYPKPPRQPSSSLTNSPYSHARDTISRPPMPRSHSYSSSSYNGWDNNTSSELHHHRPTFSDVPHYASNFQTALQHPGSPISKAQEALELLTNLCEQSNWMWIDGMLLGGCLAYGLDEHYKALDWYSKVIALDSK